MVCLLITIKPTRSLVQNTLIEPQEEQEVNTKHRIQTACTCDQVPISMCASISCYVIGFNSLVAFPKLVTIRTVIRLSKYPPPKSGQRLQCLQLYRQK